MKSLLWLFMPLMFVWGCAVQAEDQPGKQVDKQVSETLNKDSQDEKKSSTDTKKVSVDEEEPDCE